MLEIWIVALFLLGTTRGNEVCFARLGCFTDDKPWAGTIQRPLAKLPWSPEKINTRFLLYTKKNPNNVQEITAINPSTIRSSNFDSSKITRFIIHGFLGQGDETWQSEMCRRMFGVEDVNCISVDWSGGSKCEYTQASNNIRVVGAEVAYFINVLTEQYGYSPSKVHFIAHSLGAHAAGETGRRRPGLGRITGLDPAQPYFQDTPIEVRLDKTDAAFVDIIHTDSAPTIPDLGFGMSQAIGHLDFYPNGGIQMPGCTKNTVSQNVDIDEMGKGMIDLVGCNHLRSFMYYSDSIISPDGFLGYTCASYDTFQTENCFPCPKGGCPQMGHYADKYKDRVTSGIQKLYLNTGEATNFARWRYKVSVAIAGNSEVSGYVNIALYGAGGNTKQYEIVQGTLKPGKTYANFIDVELKVGTITKVKFLWRNNVLKSTQRTLGATKATVQAGEDGKVFNFCGSGTVQENVLQTLTSC
ncbi:pancreatic lipase-related protein 2-like [Mauremys mutica]|uniref:pancreatic lipase-related protein 2-like n=1 Tax=Mauremys mutica TaxID=74926 RepID=UPI001D167212|nr:pancreatic lipase-related protein 2-like [Mauremys mutica]